MLGSYGNFEGSMNDKAFSKLQDGRWKAIYPAPFFDPLAMQSVLDPKVLIQWSRFFYDWHPIVHAAINGMVTYPITDFIFDTDNEQVRKNYEKAFDILGMRDVLIRAGLDYYISGRVQMSTIMPFTRFLGCPKCTAAFAVDSVTIKPHTSKIQIECPKCKQVVIPVTRDVPTQDVNDMHVILWNPLNMKIDYDEILNMSDYYYSIPQHIKTGILKGERKYLKRYPMHFIDAVHKNKAVKIYNNKILDMRRETHSAAFIKGTGQPLITPCLKYLFHLMVLLRGQDALAIDQILPWTVISPATNAGTDPAADMDLNSWQEQVKAQYDEWKKNPLHKSIMPVPMNAQIVGANGKSLMLNPEIDAITNHILAGMGVPNEFIFGGLQWSGASVSLRMLENRFINYRTLMQRILDWVIDEISIYFGYPKIKVRMQNFKMADDVAQKQMMISLSDAKVISKRTMLAEIMPDIDYDKEQATVKKEMLAEIKLQQSVQQASLIAGIQMPTPDGPPGQDQGDGGSGKENKAGALPEQNPPRAEGANAQI